jgi:hypothetical protein
MMIESHKGHDMHQLTTPKDADYLAPAPGGLMRESMAPGSAPLSPMAAYHYASSPIQRAQVSVPVVNGITARENSAVHHLSAGQVNLHAMGASLQRVASHDPRLVAVQARSLAQGSSALVSHEADRGHELWHLAQQAMGRVDTTAQLNGRNLNTQPHLEAEADRQGALINHWRGQGDAGSGYPQYGIAGTASAEAGPVQRQVSKVKWTTAWMDAPGKQVFDHLNTITSDIDCTDDELEEAVDSTFEQPDVSVVYPTNIVASTKKGKPNGDGHGISDTRLIGQLGRDENRIRTGHDAKEAFEGGHLLGAALWDAKDADVAKMNRAVNLVPMSRAMNIYNFIEIETGFKSAKFKKWTIVPERTEYDVPEKNLAMLLELPLKAGTTGDDLVTLEAWIPNAITATQGATVLTAEENIVHLGRVQVEDGEELHELLEAYQLWNYLTDDLQTNVDDLEA